MEYQVIVIGAGAGGLVVAIGAARAGKKVLLIERENWGGDCTNFGCIPSKTLIAEAEHRKQPASKIFEHVKATVAQVRSHEDAAALKDKGVETRQGVAHFVDPHTLQVGDETISGEQIVIATGSSPHIPEIRGLKETPFLTNETVFDLKDAPKTLAVLGGGAIGCELAQAFQRLGSQVTLIHRGANLLKKEEPDAQQVIAQQFEKEGIILKLNTEPETVSFENGLFHLIDQTFDALLVSVGRQPNVAALELDKAGVAFSAKGIPVDGYGRTNQRHIWAVGDVTGGPIFTHAAENQGRTVLTSLLLPIKKRLDEKQPVPRVTFTDPEVASFGPLEHEVIEEHGEKNIKTYHVPLSENDRAITAGRTEGFVKVITHRESSAIIGATIVAPRAGEMLPELSLAKMGKIPLKKLANLIHPYPTYNLAIRKAADMWLTEILVPKLKHPLKLIPWKRYLPVFIIVTLMLVGYFSGVYEYFSFETLQSKHQELKTFVAEHPLLTPIIFMAIYAVSTSLSFPGGAVLSLVGGFLFDVPLSTIYVLVGATIGACVIFLAARSALVDMLRRKAGPFLKKMESGFKKNAWSYLLFLRFVPLFPFWLVNIAPAFFNVSLITFAWTTFVGIIPGSYVYTQTGAGLSAIFDSGQEFSLETIFNVKLRIALVALGVFSLLPIVIKKIVNKRRKRNKML